MPTQEILQHIYNSLQRIEQKFDMQAILNQDVAIASTKLSSRVDNLERDVKTINTGFAFVWTRVADVAVKVIIAIVLGYLGIKQLESNPVNTTQAQEIQDVR